MEQVEFVADYFQAEQNESIAFIVAGLFLTSLTIAMAIYYRTNFAKGVAISVMAIGVIQVVVGTTVYLRSPKDIIRVEEAIYTTPDTILTEEIPRMQSVMEAFEVYRWTEILLMLVGTILMAWRKRALMQGLGLGLTLQALIMLILDLFAEARGEVYLQQLMDLTT